MNKLSRMTALGVVGLAVGMAGCQLAALLGGHGSQEALYKFKKDQRVLVVVDVADDVSVPPLFETTLAEKIGVHLFAYKAADHIVSQERLLQLRDKDPEAYKKMGLADIAAGTDADAVLSVYITKLSTPVTSDNTVGQGDAEVTVRVVDRNGGHLWPGDEKGSPIVSHMDPALTTDRDIPATVKNIIDQLALRVGRMFHKYSLEDKDLTKGDTRGAPAGFR